MHLIYVLLATVFVIFSTWYNPSMNRALFGLLLLVGADATHNELQDYLNSS